VSPRRAWDKFWFGPVSARPLGAFRIAFGLVVLWHLALLAIELDYWLTDAGLLRGVEARLVAGPLRPSPLQWARGTAPARLAVAATAIVAALFTAGWRTRPMSVLLYLGLLAIHHRNLVAISGADCLLVIFAFYLMLSPCGAAYSLDARRRGTPGEPLVLPWAQRLIQLQVSLVYFLAGWNKLDGTTWADGTALYYVLNEGQMRRFTLGLLGWPSALQLLTHGTLVVELALPFLLWVRAARPWVLFAGIALHAGIALTVNIPVFGELLVASYLTFLTPEELDSWLRRLNPRSWRRRPVGRSLAAVPERPGRARGTLGRRRATVISRGSPP
jgi:hypothetical protein